MEIFMNRIFSWLQNVILRQIVLLCLVLLVFFTTQSFNHSNAILVAETVTTPEGIYYKGTPDNQIEKAKNKLDEAAEIVREKLNLDEQPPKATKEFLDSVQNKVQERIEPRTGGKNGYYQKENLPERQQENLLER
jgi:hypothetical protein